MQEDVTKQGVRKGKIVPEVPELRTPKKIPKENLKVEMATGEKGMVPKLETDKIS